ncbi:Pentatricopeptide repeat-containing protein [Vitis vinifera]|uniref:Pentatricopeptide repeat-containing protein n=1 Tax=Vitis vinifera TaxID=29760 RepID=A0A438G7M5_VITVI|nr:Pentatricopeptide repeat-containing protein [Vitis vinifera]
MGRHHRLLPPRPLHLRVDGQNSAITDRFDDLHSLLQGMVSNPCPCSDGIFSCPREHEKVMTVYEKMIKDRVKPDVFTFNSLISSCCRNSQFGLALEMFKEMKDKGCSPNVVSFNTLIKGSFRERKFEEGIGMAYEMLEWDASFQM